MSGSFIVSIIALIFSAFALENSLKQRKIASEAHRLNLYNKRFVIYQRTVDFYTEFFTSEPWWSDDKFVKESLKYAVVINEAKFLFNPKDGVHVLMKESLELMRQMTMREIDHDERVVGAKVNTIREKIEPYLNFHQITVDEENGVLAETRSWLQKQWIDFRVK